jgi:hypothetical protein
MFNKYDLSHINDDSQVIEEFMNSKRYIPKIRQMYNLKYQRLSDECTKLALEKNDEKVLHHHTDVSIPEDFNLLSYFCDEPISNGSLAMASVKEFLQSHYKHPEEYHNILQYGLNKDLLDQEKQLDPKAVAEPKQMVS